MFKRIRWFFHRKWYEIIYGMEFGFDGTMLPKLGHGPYVSVHRKGQYIEIKDNASGEMIRLIPYQPNHGIMVEQHLSNGKIGGRTHVDFKILKKIVRGNEEDDVSLIKN